MEPRRPGRSEGGQGFGPWDPWQGNDSTPGNPSPGKSRHAGIRLAPIPNMKGVLTSYLTPPPLRIEGLEMTMMWEWEAFILVAGVIRGGSLSTGGSCAG